jgi:hypothetical protein
MIKTAAYIALLVIGGLASIFLLSMINSMFYFIPILLVASWIIWKGIKRDLKKKDLQKEREPYSEREFIQDALKEGIPEEVSKAVFRCLYESNGSKLKPKLDDLLKEVNPYEDGGDHKLVYQNVFESLDYSEEEFFDESVKLEVETLTVRGLCLAFMKHVKLSRYET